MDLPDELLLTIFQHLEIQDIVWSVSKVCLTWEKLASDPELWRDRYVFYNSVKYNAFVETVHTAKNQIKYLHLGGHQAMEEVAIQALLSSSITVVKRLSFLGSCRTNPDTVIEILRKFGSNLKSLTLCVNDELVSFGTDKKSCYALEDEHIRPGILFHLIGNLENLQHLTLYGGFCTKWYFGELLQSPGCHKIETLDLKEFDELKFDDFTSSRKLDLVQTLLIKNKDHLKSLKLSILDASNSGVQKCVQKCHSLQKLSINIKQLIGYHNGSFMLNILELSGRFLHNRQLESIISNMSQYGDLLSRLTEFNLIQFNIIETDMFCNLSKFLHGLKILRVEGNWLNFERISVITDNAPLLERICVRGTHTVAERHFVSMSCPLTTLRNIDLDDTFDMDCIFIATKFKTIPLLNYSVIETGCDCVNHFYGNSEFEFDLGLEALSPKSCNLRVIEITLSNNLDAEFLPKFWTLSENDRGFHFQM